MKIKCKNCANEKLGYCSIKKVKVKLNKGRVCNKYILDENKVKSKVEVPVIKLGYKEQERLRQERKRELKKQKEELKTLIEEKEKLKNKSDIKYTVSDNSIKHPLTGDLSRFTTTANK